MTTPKRTKRTAKKAKRSAPDWAPRFLAALAKTGSILRACEAARVTRSNVYKRRDGEADFRGAMSLALEDGADLLKEEARRRAVDGADEPVVYKGQLMGAWVDAGGREVPPDTEGARFVPLTVKKYSDQLLALLLRANCPEFRDKVEVGGKDGGPVVVKVLRGASMDDL